jgi:hypothetical protein
MISPLFYNTYGFSYFCVLQMFCSVYFRDYDLPVNEYRVLEVCVGCGSLFFCDMETVGETTALY